jgi:1-acyl-sn-glycerol-3-phosphate acyltransferase
MNTLRSLLFNIFFYGGTALTCIILMPTLAFPRGLMMSIIVAYLHYVAAIEKWLLGLDYVVIGRENLPEGPCILAAKHQSAWETMKLHMLVNDPAVVIKKELLSLPIWGWCAVKAKLIPIDRKGGRAAVVSMLRAARAAVASGRPIAIFPQGTRVAPGVWKEYKAGVSVLYRDLGLPLVPVALNSGLYWGRNAYTKRRGSITIEILPAIPPGLEDAVAGDMLAARIEYATDRLVQAAGGPATMIPERLKPYAPAGETALS